MVKKDPKKKSYDRENFESAVEQLISKHDELKGRGFRQTNKCNLSLSLIESFERHYHNGRQLIALSKCIIGGSGTATARRR